MSGDLQVRKRRGKNKRGDDGEEDESPMSSDTNSRQQELSASVPSMQAKQQRQQGTAAPSMQQADQGCSGWLAKLLFLVLCSGLVLMAGLIYVELHPPAYGATPILVNETPNVKKEVPSIKTSRPTEGRSFDDNNNHGNVIETKFVPKEKRELDIAAIEEQILFTEDIEKASREPLIRETVVNIPDAEANTNEPVDEPPVVKEKAHVLGRHAAGDLRTSDQGGSDQQGEEERQQLITNEANQQVDGESSGENLEDLKGAATSGIPQEEKPVEVGEAFVDESQRTDNDKATVEGNSDTDRASIGIDGQEQSSKQVDDTRFNTENIQANPDLSASKESQQRSKSESLPSTGKKIDTGDKQSSKSSESNSDPKPKTKRSKRAPPSAEELLGHRSLIERGERLMEAVLELSPEHPMVAELMPHLEGAKRDLKDGKLKGLDDTTKQVLLILEDLYVRLVDQKENVAPPAASTPPAATAPLQQPPPPSQSAPVDGPAEPDTLPSSDATVPPPVAAPYQPSPSSPPTSSSSAGSVTVESVPKELSATEGGGLSVADLTEADAASSADDEHLDRLREADDLIKEGA